MDILLIRHGQTKWNREQVFRGGTDVALDQTGLRQAQLLAGRLKDLKVARIYSGPLLRATQTAQAIADSCGSEVLIHSGLDDMRFGKWEGMAHTKVAEQFPEQYRIWKSEPWRAAIPGGSSLDDISDRCWSALRGMVEENGPQAVIAVVTHRVVLKLLFLRMLGMGINGFWKLKLAPCSLSIIHWDGERFVLERFNDVCHLKEMAKKQVDF